MSSGAGEGAGVTFLGTGAGVKKSDSDHLCCKLTILSDIQPANQTVIISAAL